ncbi:hypothetical protein GCQ56_00860 [Marinifilum sp. N1E240]|uniref:hypothetical protein n=1 Tax=Marinifilum sp. N1E240 TaxID=2608082 RepID=UPI00128C90BC|nr:hypothetical protein [Marinifilum sp. N1E240]MPQ45542.1 hypothetical protein [Marinifilum sp. N1E240]
MDLNIIKDTKLELALLEAIYIMRWNKDKTSLTAVLTPEECDKIIKSIYENIEKEGYQIVKK